MKTWDEIKSGGSDHYKAGQVEPIDLYLSGGILRDLAIGSIIKYAYRNRSEHTQYVNAKDMDKIIHYAEMLKTVYTEKVIKK